MAIRTITVNNKEIIRDVPSTGLNEFIAKGSNTLSVYSTLKFTVSMPISIEDPGDSNAEILYISNSLAPANGYILLQMTLTQKDHPSDVKVYAILFDQVEFSWASTVNGTPTLLTSLMNIDVENEVTSYTDTTNNGGFYFTRFYNSKTGLYSSYSDPIPFDGSSSNTVGYIINMAMEESQKEFTNKLTYDLLIREINSCLRFIRGKLKRWSSSEVFNANLGQANRGMYKIALPTDYYDQNSNRSCLDVRIGTQDHLTYVDKQEFDDLMIDSAHSTLLSTANPGDTTITLLNAADFPEPSTLTIFVNNVVNSISYTNRDVSTGVISGIPASGVGSITTVIHANTDVWYGMFEGAPYWFTIYNGFLYWWYPTDEVVTGRTIYMDYWNDIVEVSSDGDIIPLAKFDMIKHWLKWVIRNTTERNGRPDINDQDWQLFNNILNDAVRRESTGQKFKMRPKVSGIMYRRGINPSTSYENYLRS